MANKLSIAADTLGFGVAEIDGVFKKWNGSLEDSENLTQEQIDAIDTAYNLALSSDNATQYSRDRAAAYPSIAEQLDLLYHDIKNGALDSGDWIAAIEAVKTQYPKP